MNKKYIAGLLLIASIFAVFHIIDREDTDQAQVTEEEVTKAVKKDAGKDDKVISTQDFIVFVPDETQTSLEERHITLSNPDNKTTEELLIDALSENGKDKTSYNKPIPAGIKVNDVEKKGDTVIVDFNSRGLTNNPAQESLILDSLVLTMTTLKGVDSVTIYVDGKSTEKFMGTFDVSKPLTIKDVTNNVVYLDKQEKETDTDSAEKPKEESQPVKEAEPADNAKEEPSGSTDASGQTQGTSEQNAASGSSAKGGTAADSSSSDTGSADNSGNTEAPAESGPAPIPMSVGNN